MGAPRRIQLSRAKGWRMPPNTVKVTRPGLFGNPWSIAGIEAAARDIGTPVSNGVARSIAVDSYRAWLGGELTGPPGEKHWRAMTLARLDGLRGKNLACWCALDAPCHADVLLELANPGMRCEAVPHSPDCALSDPSSEPPVCDCKGERG